MKSKHPNGSPTEVREQQVEHAKPGREKESRGKEGKGKEKKRKQKEKKQFVDGEDSSVSDAGVKLKALSPAMGEKVDEKVGSE